jgi:hypothetical protein
MGRLPNSVVVSHFNGIEELAALPQGKAFSLLLEGQAHRKNNRSEQAVRALEVELAGGVRADLEPSMETLAALLLERETLALALKKGGRKPAQQRPARPRRPNPATLRFCVEVDKREQVRAILPGCLILMVGLLILISSS